MKVVEMDSSRRAIKLKIESEEDLWVLYNVICVGDVVYSWTSRELKTRSGSKRKGMVLGIRVEWVEFQPFTTRLRVHGIIVHGPKELDLEGQRHTLSIGIGSTITIIRESGWYGTDYKRIMDACRKTTIPVLIVSIDDEEYCIAIAKGYGVQVISEGYLRLPSKLEASTRSEALRKQLKEVLNKVIDTLSRYEIKVLIIAGPGYVKENLYNEAKNDPRLRNVKIYMENTSWGGVKGVYEVIKRGILIDVLKDHDMVIEENLLDELMYYIAKDPGYVAYGLDDVEYVARARAIKKLMVVSDLVRHPNEEIRRRVEEIMKLAEEQKAEIKIFSSVHETRLKLKNLGGIAAILRYPLSKENVYI